MRKTFKHVWNIIKIITIPIIVLNLIPVICIAVIYFKGTVTKCEYGYLTPYITGWTIQIALFFFYGMYKIYSYGNKDF